MPEIPPWGMISLYWTSAFSNGSAGIIPPDTISGSGSGSGSATGSATGTGGGNAEDWPTFWDWLWGGAAGTGTNTRLKRELGTEGIARAGTDAAARLDAVYAEAKQQQEVAANLLRAPDFLRLVPTEEEARTFASGFSMIPGVGEAVDLWTICSPNATAFEKVVAGASLALNVFTLGFAPNFGGVAHEAEEAAKGFRRAAKTTAHEADHLKGLAKQTVHEADEIRGAAKQHAGGCFAAGTPVLTPDGSRSVEEIRPGDLVLSVPQDDPEASPEARVVEDVFCNYLPITELRVGHRTIRTTAEHPFWVRGRGWRQAQQLVEGDELRSHDGSWVAVRGTSAADPAPVYNMTISEYHTYFVGSPLWGFAVCSHNTLWCPASGHGGGAADRFPNLLPERLAGELADAERVGAKPIRFGDPGFNKAVNKGTIKYIVTESGEVVISPHTVKGVEISHAVLSNGQSVLAAGQAEITAWRGSYIGMNLNNHSGHFLPTTESLQTAREAFAKIGITFP